MSFVMRVNRDAWRTHQRGVRDEIRAAVHGPEVPGDIVPVAKGNGYGVGNAILAQEAAELGARTIAVGILKEAAEALEAFPGDVLVLAAVEPADPIAASFWEKLAINPERDRLILTVASAEGLVALLPHASAEYPIRVVLEALTSMHRFGMDESTVAEALSEPAVEAALADGSLVLEGLALHLPLTQPAVPQIVETLRGDGTAPMVLGTGRVQETVGWGLMWPGVLERHAPNSTTGMKLWVSHLSDTELRAVRGVLPDTPLNVRIGTRLWLGDKSALHAEGIVLAVHEGQAAGYFQHRVPRGGAVVVVGGGTSHGVAMDPPRVTGSLRARAAAAADGALEAAGKPRAPFHLPGGGQAWFHEPPHMHVSMVRLGKGEERPAVGDALRCDIRLTTVNPDQVLFE